MAKEKLRNLTLTLTLMAKEKLRKWDTDGGDLHAKDYLLFWANVRKESLQSPRRPTPTP